MLENLQTFTEISSILLKLTKTFAFPFMFSAQSSSSRWSSLKNMWSLWWCHLLLINLMLFPFCNAKYVAPDHDDISWTETAFNDFNPSSPHSQAPCNSSMFSSIWAFHSCRTATALNWNWFPSPASGARSYQSWNSMSGFWQGIDSKIIFEHHRWSIIFWPTTNQMVQCSRRWPIGYTAPIPLENCRFWGHHGVPSMTFFWAINRSLPLMIWRGTQWLLGGFTRQSAIWCLTMSRIDSVRPLPIYSNGSWLTAGTTTTVQVVGVEVAFGGITTRSLCCEYTEKVLFVSFRFLIGCWSIDLCDEWQPIKMWICKFTFFDDGNQIKMWISLFLWFRKNKFIFWLVSNQWRYDNQSKCAYFVLSQVIRRR